MCEKIVLVLLCLLLSLVLFGCDLPAELTPNGTQSASGNPDQGTGGARVETQTL